MGRPAIHNIINETTKAIWEVLGPEVMSTPTLADWKRIKKGFRKRWHFPNCIGALDGKHVSIQKPGGSATLFWNYKGYFSLVLLALVDANYKFTMVDIGEYGSNVDSNVFKASEFGEKFMEHKLNIPELKRLPNFPEEGPMPHVIVADEAFPQLHNLMRPYPRGRETTLPRDEVVYNDRLCRARMPVECAFGILAQRWRIFSRRIPLSEDNADSIIQAACCLHNYLTEDKDIDQIYTELNPSREAYLDEEGVVCLYLSRLSGYRSSQDAMGVCDVFKSYLNSPQGRVAWQEDRITYRRET